MLNFFRHQSKSLRNDLLSGVTVALALVPEAIAFAFVAGLSPLIGLYSAFFIGLISAILGGRPGMISGATGAMAVVVVSLVAMHGIEYLFPTVILCGILQIAIGLGRLGKLIRMVPHSVMLGFVNGLAIVIGLAQLSSFKTLSPEGVLVFLAGPKLLLMLSLVLLTMAIIWLLPKVTTAVPASLAAIATVTLIAIGVNYTASDSGDQTVASNPIATVGDMLQTNAAAAKTTDHSHAHGVESGLAATFNRAKPSLLPALQKKRPRSLLLLKKKRAWVWLSLPTTRLKIRQAPESVVVCLSCFSCSTNSFQ